MVIVLSVLKLQGWLSELVPLWLPLSCMDLWGWRNMLSFGSYRLLTAEKNNSELELVVLLQLAHSFSSS